MSHPLPAKPSTGSSTTPAPALTPAPAPTPTPAPAPRPAPTPVPTLVPSSLAHSTSLLVSAVQLPLSATVVCRCWTGLDESIENARRHIYDVATGAPDIAAALATVVRPDAELTIWAFAVVAIEAETTPALCRFDLAHIHPCSAQCATSAIACAECTKPRPANVCPLGRMALRSSRPVRQPLRHLYQLWISALRALVLERLTHPHLLPTPHGVLLNPPQTPTGEWGRPWSEQRSLTHAHLHISLLHPLPRPSPPTHILVHLLPHTTHLFAIPSTNPPIPGTPLRLLPALSPAYALAPHSGPTPSGFLQSLGGRGVPPSASVLSCILVWLPLPPASGAAASPPGLPTPSAATPAAVAGGTGSRGMYAVWPRSLCVVDSKMAAIDVSKLPSLPVGLIVQGGSAWVKPRRFGGTKSKLTKPITLAQPGVSAQPQPPQVSTSSQPLQSQIDLDPSLASLANTASNLIDAVVRAREKEKEKQRARMERARSGSAVPIPIPGPNALAGVATGPSTPVDAVHPITATAQQQAQTQTPTSGLYPSPLANTPIHYVGSGASVASVATSNPSAVAGPSVVGAPAPNTTGITSPNSDDTFGIGMDLFGDQEFGVGDTDPVFGDAPFTETPFTFPYDSTITASSAPEADPFPDLQLWNVPEVQQDQKQLDEDAEFRDEYFNFFGWGGPGGNAPLVAEPPVLAMDIDPPEQQQQPNPPAPSLSPSPTPKLPQVAQEKPYFPLTPPSEESEGNGAKPRSFDPLKFTSKFESVDEKYRWRAGKFGINGRLIVDRKRTRAATFIGAQTGANEAARAGRTRSLSGAAGTARATEDMLTTGILAKRMQLGLGLQYGSVYSQYPPPPRQFPQLELHHLPKFQHIKQLPTPQPSPNAHRRLRAGYVDMTNPSAKRIRTLRHAHGKPRAESETAVVSVFARDWVAVEVKKVPSRPHSPTATLSSTSSDSESDESDMDFVPGTASHTAAPSRGTTPPTSAHPSGTFLPGPGLLLALFRPSMLGSGALGDVLAWADGKETKPPAPGPVSVPTPVSPGCVHEASKEVIEASANVLAREAVDNWAWGTDHSEPLQLSFQLPSRTELMLLGTCLGAMAPGMVLTLAKFTAMPKIEVVNEILTDRSYPQLPRLEKLRQPKISVGHSGQIVQMGAPVLRFWEKIGLEPVGGAKDVVAYAVFEEGEEGGMVKRWVEKVGRIYEAKKLGKHVLGGVEGGLVPVKWENIEKTLVSFISLLPQTTSHIIFYLIFPQRALSIPLLRAFLPNIPTLTGHRERLTSHLVPASIVFEHAISPGEFRQRLESAALAVYDRIPRAIGRRVRRQIFELSAPAETIVHVPAFTLARPLAPRFRFSMEWPDGQREVMDRHMFLHVAYGFSKSSGWLGAACVDERGEAYETKVWRTLRGDDDHARVGEDAKEDMSVAKVVAKVWAFAMRFAKRAAIEWRIVFCRMGGMGLEELEAWETHTAVVLSDVRMGMHVSVLSFDQTSGLALSSSASPGLKAPAAVPGMPPSAVIDITANDYLVLPGFDTEICTIPDLESTTDPSPGLLPLATAHFFRLTDPPITRPIGRIVDIPSKPDDPPVTAISCQLHLLHVALTRNSSLWKSGGDPWRELLQSFYSLSILTQSRMPSLDPLPIHLAMLSVILDVADNRELVPVDLPNS